MYQHEELDSFGSGYGLLESPYECGIEPPDSISHGISELVKYIGNIPLGRPRCR